jgi:hypothetical protein
MIAEEKDTNTISKKNNGFPDYLDFEKLRRESIEYVGQLSGKIWTDHNVHDPGITILEMLCYALLDLGYRTHLPIEDILATKSDSDNNFFTPAQILSCNPLTITDYRKLLIDIKGVKNAWLFPADDQEDICRQHPEGMVIPTNQPFINGLYHVSIELENYPEQNNAIDINEFASPILKNIKLALMAHRNFCEDFLDIHVLCRFEVGVCASIELEDNADAEAVYVEMVDKLNSFFSPAPRFYTLRQLLDKDLPIDAIFAGRPYNKTESHGFIDTTELEAIKLRKEILTSDVYNVLFQVKGIKKITSLRLNNCQPNAKAPGNWKMSIPKNNIASFSVGCSGFEFNRNGLRINADTKKFDTLFQLGFSSESKTVYPATSPYLDLPLPKGNFSDALGDYYSIQNEFPQVYGIGNGDLPENSSIPRKAQALQLKGYLLFFDQLLANYLSQLQNIRNLFSLSAPKTEKEKHTYFFNQLQTVPEMDKLLRFSAGNASLVGMEGATLALPIATSDWEKLKTFRGTIQDKIASLTPYEFVSMSAVNDAMQLLQNDLITSSDTTIQITHAEDGTWFYSILVTDSNYVLLCKKTFDTEQAAKHHAASVQYTATHVGNYHDFITPNNLFSFEIEFNITSYTGYLGLLLEDETLYHNRRKDFMNHLLARFAEKFTDFALLNWQDKQAISTTENFLTQYDDLSRNRGRGYDYQLNGWNSDNSSGFEKKVKVLSGISQGATTLCNFVVEPCEEHFTVSLLLGKDVLFESEEKFDSRAEAEVAAATMIKALANPSAYRTPYFGHEKYYQLQLHYGYAIAAKHPETFQNSQHAEQLAAYLARAVDPHPETDDVVISNYIWKAELRNHQKEVLAISTTDYATADKAHLAGIKQARKSDDPTIWKPTGATQIPVLHAEKINDKEVVLIDNEAFKIDINDTIIRKPGQYTYDLLDKNNTFKLSPKTTFDNSKAAGVHAHNMLATAADLTNWQIEREPKTGRFIINICKNNIAEASFVTTLTEYTEAEEHLLLFYQLINEHIYSITESEHADKWKFRFTLGYEKENTWIFQSDREFLTSEDAHLNAIEFYGNINALTLKKAATSGFALVISGNEKTGSLSLLPDEKKSPVSQEQISRLIQSQRELLQFFINVTENRLNQYVKADVKNEQPSFHYRLVNNNRIPAKSLMACPPTEDPHLFKRKIAAAYKQQQWFPTICLGGDILKQHTDAMGNTLYHYEIRFRNLPFANGQEIPVFRSTMGYATPDEAETAFNENYLTILRIASSKNAYGKDISLEPVYIPQIGKRESATAIACVPEKAQALFEKNYKENWITEIAHFARAYPVKMVKSNSKDFATLFCKEIKPEDKQCSNEASVKSVYYFSFSLFNSPVDPLTDCEWISTGYFDTPEETMEAFVYFNRLLGYTGNWYIDCDTCSLSKKSELHFFIREVLAESITCFSSVEEAWGPLGVEAFICAVQEGKGIRNYANKTDCCYSFHISCGPNLLTHPCTYDTSEKRDESMNELYNSMKKSADTKAFTLTYEGNDLLLNNKEGIPVAKVRNAANMQSCEIGIAIAETIATEKSTWITDQGIYFLKSEDQKIILESHEKTSPNSFAEWKTMLEEWACFYPITRTVVRSTTENDESGTAVRNNTYTYCIEIKIPGFNTCTQDKAPDVPCTCAEQVPVLQAHCYIAWKSSCCFNSCEEALEALLSATKLLEDFKNYYPVFDCKCGSFGIALADEVKVMDDATQGIVHSKSIVDGQIIARNPQCYQTPEEVCQAVEDAKQLINAGGLHVVEHILLRPHCQEDCACDERLQHCDTYNNCDFPPYRTDNNDPCVPDRQLHFTPGTDPYSFIATVLLPAWPSVFGNEDKRKQAEHILFSEAPSHVLLRVLWLRPMDFYLFETNFKAWKKWLAGIPNCTTNFSVCDFFNLVVKKEYTCLPACDTCLPCKDSKIKTGNPCAQRIQESASIRTRNAFDFLNLVNNVFCMGEYQCGGEISEGKDHTRVVSAKKDAIVVEKNELKKENTIKKIGTKAEQEKVIKKTEPEKTSTRIDLKEKAKFINGRHNAYLKLVNGATEHTNGNPVAIKTAAFIQNNNPVADRLEMLVKEILQNKKPDTKKSKPLTKKRTEDLLHAAICHYLDKVVFNGKDPKKIEALSPVIHILKKAKINLQLLYKHWDPERIAFYESEFDAGIIKKLFTNK